MFHEKDNYICFTNTVFLNASKSDFALKELVLSIWKIRLCCEYMYYFRVQKIIHIFENCFSWYDGCLNSTLEEIQVAHKGNITVVIVT